MRFKQTLGVLTIAIGVCALAGHANAATPAKKKPAAKTVVSKNLRASLKTKAAPGRTPVPVDGDFSPSPNGYSVKLKPKNGKVIASKLPPKRTVAAVARPVTLTEPVSNYVRTIRVGAVSPTPQLAQGEGLAVQDAYIVTSADFVTEAWTNSGEVKFFVSDSTQPLQLVGFDLGSNLAVFTTGLNTHMEHTLPLQRLRFEALATGEDFTALGSSGLIGGARMLRTVQDLTFVRQRFELPASVALGGGTTGTQFLFDKSGRWVGSVSLLDQRDGRKFDVTSANQAYEMIRQLELRPPVAIPSSVLQQQAASYQERWTNTFFESAKKGLALHSLDCSAEALHVDNTTVASELVRTRLVHCANYMPVSLSRDYSIGFELVTGDVNYTNDVKTFLAKDSSPTTVFSDFGAHSRAPASINVMTGPECEKSDIANTMGHHVHVRFCTSALKNANGLNDTTITTISSDTGITSSVHSLHLRGFDPKNAKRFMEWMIETETIQ